MRDWIWYKSSNKGKEELKTEEKSGVEEGIETNVKENEKKEKTGAEKETFKNESYFQWNFYSGLKSYF